MEAVLVGVIIVQAAVTAYTMRMTSKDRNSLLNAVMARSTPEFVQLQAINRPKRKKRETHIQDDYGIAHGL